MTTKNDHRRREILALEPRLFEYAGALSRDEDEARALLRETLQSAEESEAGSAAAADTQVMMFRLLRQRFHSVERDRDYRRSLSAAVNELKVAHKRALAAGPPPAEAPEADPVPGTAPERAS